MIYKDYGSMVDNEGIVFQFLAHKATKKHKAKDFDENFYAELTTKFNNLKFGEILKQSFTSGYCYFYALMLAKSMPNCNLVHGNLNKLNANYNDCFYEPFIHAWVEKDDMVFDTSAKKVFDKSYYYKIYEAEPKKIIASHTLDNNETFFKLGIHSASFKPEIFKKFLDLNYECLKDCLFDDKLINESISVVKSEGIKRHIQNTISEKQQSVVGKNKK